MFCAHWSYTGPLTPTTHLQRAAGCCSPPAPPYCVSLAEKEPVDPFAALQSAIGARQAKLFVWMDSGLVTLVEDCTVCPLVQKSVAQPLARLTWRSLCSNMATPLFSAGMVLRVGATYWNRGRAPGSPSWRSGLSTWRYAALLLKQQLLDSAKEREAGAASIIDRANKILENLDDQNAINRFHKEKKDLEDAIVHATEPLKEQLAANQVARNAFDSKVRPALVPDTRAPRRPVETRPIDPYAHQKEREEGKRARANLPADRNALNSADRVRDDIGDIRDCAYRGEPDAVNHFAKQLDTDHGQLHSCGKCVVDALNDMDKVLPLFKAAACKNFDDAHGKYEDALNAVTDAIDPLRLRTACSTSSRLQQPLRELPLDACKAGSNSKDVTALAKLNDDIGKITANVDAVLKGTNAAAIAEVQKENNELTRLANSFKNKDLPDVAAAGRQAALHQVRHIAHHHFYHPSHWPFSCCFLTPRCLTWLSSLRLSSPSSSPVLRRTPMTRSIARTSSLRWTTSSACCRNCSPPLRLPCSAPTARPPPPSWTRTERTYSSSSHAAVPAEASRGRLSLFPAPPRGV